MFSMLSRQDMVKKLNNLETRIVHEHFTELMSVLTKKAMHSCWN